jgi:hypothetical protein
MASPLLGSARSGGAVNVRKGPDQGVSGRTERVMKISAVITGLIFTVAFVVGPLSGAFAQSHGARCPQGSVTHFSNNVLSCTKTHTDVADVSCPPAGFLANVEMVTTSGKDKCKVPFQPVTKDTPNAGCFALPGDQGWQLRVDPNGQERDRCERSRTEYLEPHVF